MTEKPQHAPMKQFPFIDGELHIGGVPLTQLAEQVGQTPFYAYDRNLISQRIQHLRHNLPADIRLHYAIKANPMAAVVQHLATLVDGFDLASSGEMKIALDTPMPRQHISFAGPGKTETELRQAVAAGIVINLESQSEMRRVAQIADELGLTPQVAIRVNPDFELKTAGMKMGGGPKPFGIDAERVPAVLKELGSLKLHFHGLHIYWGSQSLNPSAIMEAHERTFELAIRLSEHSPSPARLLNIGGGFGIPYFPGEKHLDLQPIGEHLHKLLSTLKTHHPQTEVATELGRYLVGEAGIYVCKVVDIKESRGETFIVTNGGLHHHLAASGNFGQVVRKNYPIANAKKGNQGESMRAHIVGPLCTPLDILGDNILLDKTAIHDLVVIYQSGAYGLSASPHRFLSHTAAPEVLV